MFSKEEVVELALKEFRRAWVIGGEAFQRECLEQMAGKAREGKAN